MYLISLLALLLTTISPEGIPPLGIIDFYGLRTISEGQARQALHIKEGDVLTENPVDARPRLEALPGVVRASTQLTCCEGGKTLLYVGIQERGTPTLKFHKAPQGKVRLPDEVWKAAEAYEAALSEAVLKGDAQEDWSQGHSLALNPGVRAVQKRFITLASRDLKSLREVLRHSGNPGHRAVAAEVLPYSADKKAVAADLIEAIHDPDGGVRNNAMRALMVLALFAQNSPGRGIRIPTQPFIEMLNSIEWSDRNKASAALGYLTFKRDPAMIASLRKQALPALIEMARWKSPGHAHSAFTLLGRIVGMTEEVIDAAWERGNRESAIRAARKGKGKG